MNDKYKPGKGWKHLAGAVYERNDGLRVHLLGLCRLPNGLQINESGRLFAPSRCFIRVNGGNRKRGLMAWAKSLSAIGSSRQPL